MDMGGSHFNLMIVDNSGNFYFEEPLSLELNTEMEKKEIMSQLKEGFDNLLKNSEDIKISAIGAATPRPFDYEKGILVGESHKFHKAKDINLKFFFKYEYGVDSYYLNDGDAFVYGEYIAGAAKEFPRVMGITLGTGLGAGFIVNDKISLNEYGTPKDGEIWNFNFLDGILEDYFSTKGIGKLYKEFLGKEMKISVKELEDEARGGKEYAIELWHRWGSLLGDGLRGIVHDFKPDVLVCGGKISRAFDIFGPNLTRDLKSRGFEGKIVQSKLDEKAALYGVARVVFEKIDTKKQIIASKLKNGS